MDSKFHEFPNTPPRTDPPRGLSVMRQKEKREQTCQLWRLQNRGRDWTGLDQGHCTALNRSRTPILSSIEIVHWQGRGKHTSFPRMCRSPHNTSVFMSFTHPLIFALPRFFTLFPSLPDPNYWNLVVFTSRTRQPGLASFAPTPGSWTPLELGDYWFPP